MDSLRTLGVVDNRAHVTLLGPTREIVIEELRACHSCGALSLGHRVIE